MAADFRQADDDREVSRHPDETLLRADTGDIGLEDWLNEESYHKSNDTEGSVRMDPNSSDRSAHTGVSGDHSIIKATKDTEIFRADEWTGYVFCGMVFLIIMTTWLTGFLMRRCSKRRAAVARNEIMNETKTRVEKAYLSPHGRKAHTTRNCRSLAHLKEHERRENDVCRLCRYAHDKDQ